MAESLIAPLSLPTLFIQRVGFTAFRVLPKFAVLQFVGDRSVVFVFHVVTSRQKVARFSLLKSEINVFRRTGVLTCTFSLKCLPVGLTYDYQEKCVERFLVNSPNIVIYPFAICC